MSPEGRNVVRRRGLTISPQEIILARNSTEAQPELNEQNPPEEQAPETPVTVDLSSFETAVKAAIDEVTTAEAAFREAATTGDMAAMLKGADAVKAAQAKAVRAKQQLDAAAFEVRAAERGEFAVTVKTAIDAVVDALDGAQFHSLGLRSIVAVCDETGHFTVSVLTNERPSAAAKPGRKASTPSGAPSADGKNRSLWTLTDGSTCTSRELIERFGDEVEPGYGVKALDRADNWKEPRWGPNNNEPMKAGPGFNAALMKIAEKVGATR
jgi:hypothetical protein